ncbi:MAG TPA: amidohydrolase family protein [Gemmatimonadales bacterium]|jgi:imidazolonepropionase-like amidohydrolase|nr:amidohydrolase family protein [Gemmatimonadales bacterium]
MSPGGSRSIPSPILLLTLGVGAAPGFPAAAQAPPAAPAAPIVLQADRVLDGRGNLLGATRIVVQHGKIARLDPPSLAAAVSYDLRGYTVLPGWIDVHVHIGSHFGRDGRISTEQEPRAEAVEGAAANARATLLAGFTTVQSVGEAADKPLRDAIARGELVGPRILTSLDPIIGKGESTGTPGELRAMVRRLAQDGADLIKIFASKSQRVGAGPTLGEEQLAILCGEARARGLRTLVHAYRSSVAAAARAGCTQVEHATYADSADLAVLARAGTWFSPQVGLVVQSYLENKARYLGVGNYTEEGFAIMARDLPLDYAICRAGVATPGLKIVFSTDATAGAHGRNAEEFFGRVTECGQSPMAALVSANSLAAQSLGMADRIGAIAPGMEADIIALDGNPLEDLTAVRRVVFVMKGGVVYQWAGGR